MLDPKDDSPLGQALRYLIDTSARMAACDGWGQVVITYRKGKIETVTGSQSHQFPNIPCRPPAVRSKPAGSS